MGGILIHPELSYIILGLCFDVYNELGFGYQEKYYQRAFSLLLDERKILYKREQKQLIKFKNIIIGRYFVDFVVDNKIVVEFKVTQLLHEVHVNQVLAYLKAVELKLGILVLIAKTGVKYKRIVN